MNRENVSEQSERVPDQTLKLLFSKTKHALYKLPENQSGCQETTIPIEKGDYKNLVVQYFSHNGHSEKPFFPYVSLKLQRKPLEADGGQVLHSRIIKICNPYNRSEDGLLPRNIMEISEEIEFKQKDQPSKIEHQNLWQSELTFEEALELNDLIDRI